MRATFPDDPAMISPNGGSPHPTAAIVEYR
jgi:hypothetical protein